MAQNLADRLRIALLLLRLSLGLVMMIWAFDKILNPGHGAAVLDAFYGVAGVGEQVVRTIGIIGSEFLAEYLPKCEAGKRHLSEANARVAAGSLGIRA